jgi:Fe-S-cluster containining protein
MSYDLNYYGTLDTSSLAEDTPSKPMPDLCHKCGRCCRSATTFHSHTKLKQLAEEGDKEAQDFLTIFEPYDTLDAARAVVPEQVEQVLELVRQREDMREDELTFYHCRYVTPEGLCGIYDRRPRCCQEAPGHGWSAMPPGCGFEGWQFANREEQKQAIRQLKTSAYLLEQLSPDGVHHPTRPETTLEELQGMIAKKIQPWKRFGASSW